MADKDACTRKALVSLSMLAMVAALGAGVTGTVFLLKTKTAGALEAVPEWAFLTVIILSAVVFVVSACGCLGAVARSRVALWVFALAMMLTVIVQTVSTVFLLLYANDQPTISALDDAVVDAQNELELALVQFAIGKPDDWIDTQNLFVCCGIDFEETLNFAALGYTRDAFLDVLLTGETRDCASSHAKVKAVQDLALNGTYTAAEVNTAVTAELGADFFCKDKIRTLTVQSSLYLGIGSGVVVLLQITAVACAFRLLCCGSSEESDYIEMTKKATAGELAGTGPAAPQNDNLVGRRPSSFF